MWLAVSCQFKAETDLSFTSFRQHIDRFTACTVVFLFSVMLHFFPFLLGFYINEI